MTTLRIPKDWLATAGGHDVPVDVIGRRIAGSHDPRPIDSDKNGTLLVQCRIKNAKGLRLTSDAVNTLQQKVAELLEKAVRLARKKHRQEVNGDDLTDLTA